MKIKNVALYARLVVLSIGLLSFVFPAAALTSEITLSISDGKTVVSPSSNVSNSSHNNWTATSGNTKVATVEMKTSSLTSTRTPEIYVTPVAKGQCTVTVKYGTSGSTWQLTVNVTEPAVPREIEYDGVKIAVLGATDTLDGEDLVLTFAESGSLTLPQTFDESRILVVGGGGLRGAKLVDNPHEVFRAFADSGEKWENGVLVEGGCHYGFMEVDVTTNRLGKWTCSLTPCYEIIYQEWKGDRTLPANHVEYVRPPEGPSAPPPPPYERVKPYVRATWSRGEMQYRRVEE